MAPLTGDLLGERARVTPARTAVVEVSSGRRLSYAALDARARAAAGVVRGDFGLRPGDRLGLLAGNSIEFLDLFFAAPKAGFVFVPLSLRLAPPELAAIVRDSGLRVLVYDAASAQTVTALQQLVTLDRWVALEAGVLAEAVQRATEGGPPRPEPWALERRSPEDLHCLLYTSGTTGRPKGVMIPYRMVVWNAYNTVLSWRLRGDDVSPIFTPLAHAGGLTVFLTPLVAAGGTVVLHRGFDPGEIWRTIERERCTVALGVPTIWQRLLDAPEFATIDLRHVRWFISGGAPLPVFLVDEYRRRGVVLKQGYGLTEVGVNCFTMTCEDALRKKGSIGKPLMFTDAKLVDDEGREVAVGEVGELWLRGPHVCRGYWNDPEATAAVLDADGWFHTGDLARCDAEGFYYIAGRKKDLFISGGLNVYPAEVEAALLAHPDVADAAVIGVADPVWGEVGVAFIVARAGRPVTEPALVPHLEARLARYKIPKAFVLVDALPRTPYGKVLKRELAAQYAARRASPGDGGEEKTP